MDKKINNKLTASGKRKALKPSTWRVGFEYTGCINSGRRPKILRLNHLYFVGVESVIDISRVLLSKKVLPVWNYSKANGPKPTKRIVKYGNDKIYIFTTASSAHKKFEELNEEVVEFNDRIRAEKNVLLEKYKAGDFNAGVTLHLNY